MIDTFEVKAEWQEVATEIGVVLEKQGKENALWVARQQFNIASREADQALLDCNVAALEVAQTRQAALLHIIDLLTKDAI